MEQAKKNLPEIVYLVMPTPRSCLRRRQLWQLGESQGRSLPQAMALWTRTAVKKVNRQCNETFLRYNVICWGTMREIRL